MILGLNKVILEIGGDGEVLKTSMSVWFKG